MHYYRVNDYKVKSDYYYKQLVEVPEGEVDVTICQNQGILSEEEIATEGYGFGESYSYINNRTCKLEIQNGNRITYALKPGGNQGYLGTYMLGYGMAMLALQRGELAMHCSVVADDGGALLIAGESGSGKSTVTAEFLKAGYAFVADDMSVLKCHEDKVYAAPAFPYQKLCRDALSKEDLDREDLIYIDETKDKFMVPYQGTFCEKPLPVKAMLVLVKYDGEEVEHNEVTGINKLHACLNNLFLRNLLGDQKYAPNLVQSGLKTAAGFPIYVIARPAEKNTLQEIISIAMRFANSK